MNKSRREELEVTMKDSGDTAAVAADEKARVKLAKSDVRQQKYEDRNTTKQADYDAKMLAKMEVTKALGSVGRCRHGFLFF